MGKIGIIGGTGLYKMLNIKNSQEIEIKTPFGKPSDVVFVGNCGDKEIVFLPRHGKDHTILPTEINYRANICALKLSGVTKIISISAVGSLKEEISPGQMVVVDQFFDRTNRRKDNTFFGDGLVAHVQFGDPVCHGLRNKIIMAGEKHTDVFYRTGTYVNMEGPAFSTKAESLFYKSLGFDVIGMTNLVEAKLSREAEMCYATIALVTDYDCWRVGEESVNVEMIIETINKNVDFSRNLVKSIIEILDPDEKCACNTNLQYALVTAMDKVPQETKNKLSFLLAPYLK
ncbi:MAG: S-methyl-5'-thioadenosine phosphorylase [Candidatus Aureabacteria bacterium]|nr:S-methyl-5'-thioadenosine phosphorylase [Candidatus Auribacterota bacterium]